MQVRNYRQNLDLLYDFIRLGRLDPGKQYTKVIPPKELFTIWTGLIHSFVIFPLNTSLPAEVTIFGQIDRVLMDEETVKIVDMAQFY